MNNLSREQLINEIQDSFVTLMDQYDIDEIGIFEEEGQENQYYLGYTVRKDGKAYMIHHPYQKNRQGELTPLSDEWTVETDEPDLEDKRGYDNLDEVFNELL
ncbi:hypothetical protein HNQ94_003419 [Salirhabdus euzebyi]|uniref:GK1464-like domain-containing protein n=1 Tax=Salirhabdus euzebyi TaxID=394506 RepID=A0A841Q950_9BACI|nr:DUF5634 family protein [Salirhabdus euzebyi]MBB6454930.1 hypothetical protein [Salirhabdus euzebyi]